MKVRIATLLPTRRDLVVAIVGGIATWLIINATRGGIQWLWTPREALVWPDESFSPAGGDDRAREKSLRQHIREKQRVRQLDVTESQLRVSEVPRGTFGMVSVHFLKADSGYIWPFHESFQIEQSGYATGSSEVHVLPNGSIFVLGFVSADVARGLKRPGYDRGSFVLYSILWDRASAIVAIPYNRLKIDRVRSLELADVSFSALDVTVK
jgi:hypothetical protein